MNCFVFVVDVVVRAVDFVFVFAFALTSFDLLRVAVHCCDLVCLVFASICSAVLCFTSRCFDLFRNALNCCALPFLALLGALGKPWPNYPGGIWADLC